MNGAFIFLSAIALASLLTGLATGYARRRGLIDHPGDRHSHRQPTPRGGGAGLVAALLLVSLLLFPGDVPTAWSRCIAPGIIVLALTGIR